MSAISVIPSGYLSSGAYASLTTAQQKAANGAQTLLNSQYALATQGLGNAGSILNIGASPDSNLPAAAQAGIASQQSALSALVVNAGGGDGAASGGIGVSNIAQLSVLNALTRAGATNAVFGGQTQDDATSSVASGLAAQAASKATLVNSALGSLTGSDPGSSIVSLYYNQRAASAIGSLYSAQA